MSVPVRAASSTGAGLGDLGHRGAGQTWAESSMGSVLGTMMGRAESRASYPLEGEAQCRGSILVSGIHKNVFIYCKMRRET